MIVSGSIYRRPISLPLPPPDGRILKWPNLKVFSFEELISASRRFRYDIQGLVIGKGCFGPVYKGCLDENTLTPAKAGYGMAVAIKMFNQDYVRGFEEWQVTLILSLSFTFFFFF